MRHPSHSIPDRRGYSMASILLLTTVVAIYAAGLGRMAVAKEKIEPAVWIALGAAGLVLGIGVGVGVGLMRRWTLRHVLWAALAGAACGPPSAMLLLAPDSLWVILVGAVVLIFYAGVVRSLSSRRPKVP